MLRQPQFAAIEFSRRTAYATTLCAQLRIVQTEMGDHGMNVLLLIGLSGLAALVYGCYRAWPPLGWIVGGLILALFAVLRSLEHWGKAIQAEQRHLREFSVVDRTVFKQQIPRPSSLQ